MSSLPKITFTQFMSTPAAYSIENTLRQNPAIMNGVIDCISIMPDPFIMNQIECYMFPQKAVEVLCSANIYLILVLKNEKKNGKSGQSQNCYIYLNRLFQNMKKDQNLPEILLGYINKVLLSLVRKTPQIYEYFKQNPQCLELILRSQRIFKCLQDFIVMFLCESTMQLYIFMKNSLIRMILSRILEGQNSNILYDILCKIYKEVIDREKLSIKQDQQQLKAVRQNFEDQDFISLIIFKINSKNMEVSLFIGKLIGLIISHNPLIIASFNQTHLDHINQYFQQYEESSDFMFVLTISHLQVLKLATRLCCQMKPQFIEYKQQTIKRLLVYSSVHQNVTILQTLFYNLISFFLQSENIQILKSVNFIAFIQKNKNQSQHKYGIKSLMKRICKICSKSDKFLMMISEDDKKIINDNIKQNQIKFNNSKYFDGFKKKNQKGQQKQKQQKKTENMQIVNQQTTKQQQNGTIQQNQKVKENVQ